MTTTHSAFLLTPIGMTLNDLESPIHLKVWFPADMLDICMLWLSELTMRD